MNANWLILDYYAVCESRGEVLDLSDFVEFWVTANEVAEEKASALLEEAGASFLSPSPRGSRR